MRLDVASHLSALQPPRITINIKSKVLIFWLVDVLFFAIHLYFPLFSILGPLNVNASFLPFYLFRLQPFNRTLPLVSQSSRVFTANHAHYIAQAAAGVKHIWLQPGAESAEVYTAAADAKVDIIAGGPCLLVRLGFSDDF